MISKPTHYFDLTEIYPVLISFFNCNVPLPRPFYGEIQDCKNRIAKIDSKNIEWMIRMTISTIQKKTTTCHNILQKSVRMRIS